RGEILMGEAPAVKLETGEALRISTGGMLPEGGNAVVMVEHTEFLSADTLAVYKAVAPGENTIARGEDLRAGAEVLPAGQRLRPQDLGILASLGKMEVEVAARPRVALLSTGDELVPPEEVPGPGQIRETNSYTLAALAEQCGAEVSRLGIVPDEREALMAALQKTAGYDCVVLTGGSSAGIRDHVAACIAALGRPGVLFHGVSMRPGKPLIYGLVDGRPYFGLSGNPTSALVGFLLFVRPLLWRLTGEKKVVPRFWARTERNLSSTGGREDYVRAYVYEKEGQWWARPILGQSNLLSTAVRANALLRIPENSEGAEPGDWLEVLLLGQF
ncbi:MAG TPA: molybdopterin molybdotransferase MoeA, partial [Firmicutes bacterium]|nr:molybdopterin molybdotransferase MoeA [Bacillota bacterium]